MKITDYCIIFTVTALCFITVISERRKAEYNMIYLNIRYNVIMDNAVENSLRAAYESIDSSGRPEVNLIKASDYLTNELSVMLDGDKMLREYYHDRVKLIIYTDYKGYYCYDSSRCWSGCIEYSYKEKTNHSDRINELLCFIKEEYNIELSVPYNDGESYENTIDDYSLIAVYEGYDGIYCFSGAKIKEFR